MHGLYTHRALLDVLEARAARAIPQNAELKGPLCITDTLAGVSVGPRVKRDQMPKREQPDVVKARAALANPEDPNSESNEYDTATYAGPVY